MLKSASLNILENVSVETFSLDIACNLLTFGLVPSTFVFFSFLLLFSLFFEFCTRPFKVLKNPSIYFFFKLVLIFLLLFVLFKIIHITRVFFQFHPFLICQIWSLFFWLLFILFKITLKFIFLQFHPSSTFFLSDLILVLLIAIFFYFHKIFKLRFFFISSFNIKLVENWAFWLS